MFGIGKTDVGRIRSNNQDSILAQNTNVGIYPNLYIVADGMGGHNAGEVASSLCVSSVLEFLSASDINDINEALVCPANDANVSVYNHSLTANKFQGMGTTLLAMVVKDDVCHILNIGDCRLYVINKENRTIDQITTDHSYVMELYSLGKISKEEAENHPNKNIITRAVGTKHAVESDLFTYGVRNNDFLLMCSDGLSNMVSNEEMLSIVTECESLDEAVDKLISTANNNGGLDNISIILASQISEV